MAQVMNTPNGPLLCSRINANSTTRGDLLVSDDGQRVVRVIDMHRNYQTGLIVIHVDGTDSTWRFRSDANTPLWRAVGARAAGHFA